MNKLFLDTNYSFIIPRLSELHRFIRYKDTSDVNSMTAEDISNIYRLIGKMQKPMFVPLNLSSMDRPTSKDFNDEMKHLEGDIAVCYQGIKDNTKNMNLEFNSISTDIDDMIETAQKMFETVESINISNDKDDAATVVTGDDFNDGNMIDTEYGLDADMCHLDIGQGGITLPLNSETQINISQASVKIANVNKDKEGPYDKGPEPINFFYEGQFYGKTGEAMPEGGSWDIEVVESDDSIPYDDRLLLNTVRGDNNDENPSFIIGLLNGTTILKNNSQITTPNFSASISKPPEANLMRSRMAMLDNNPDTFWQCEWVFRPGVTEDDNVRLENISSNFLEVTLTIDLGQHFRINKIKLDPVVFGARDDIVITRVTTSRSRDELPKPLDFQGFGVYNEQITDNSNISIDDIAYDGSISPVGLDRNWGCSWIFEMREIRFINMTIRQNSFYVTPYQTKEIFMSRTATAVSSLEEV